MLLLQRDLCQDSLRAVSELKLHLRATKIFLKVHELINYFFLTMISYEHNPLGNFHITNIFIFLS